MATQPSVHTHQPRQRGPGEGVCPTPSDTFFSESVRPVATRRTTERHHRVSPGVGADKATLGWRSGEDPPLQPQLGDRVQQRCPYRKRPVLCWGRTCQPTGWPEGGGTPLGCAEACLFQKCLTDGLPRWLGGNAPAVREAGDTQVGPLDGESPRSGTWQPTPLSLRASLVAQTVKNLLQCRRPGFDPRVRKIPGRRGWLC